MMNIIYNMNQFYLNITSSKSLR